jgi:hypothetical protein
MMIRGGRVPWRSEDDGPSASRPLFIVAVVLVAVWVVALAALLVGWVWQFL